MHDWYNNSNSFIYLRVGKTFFRRTTGVGWAIITEQQADEAIRQWDILHEKQRETYLPQLQAQGLIR
ncbi:hypothetical protein [Spirosoma radiotolerans]|uniref:Uncharacterized protein n=1 Tax=Spirosoma radiotolerans TaxID=1379870 RepID=A0A0E3ZVD7_9BACT|nr:hypothetical protein [Spirosoma radiotolerans]AKD55045.1 hypothetical protein SD10_09140 [Spirosoma radiotolerans]